MDQPADTSDFSPTQASLLFQPSKSGRAQSQPGEEEEDESEDAPKKTKTGRAAKACDACRRRKIRCDQAKPRCNHCIASHLECLFHQRRRPRGRTSQIVPELRREQWRETQERLDDSQLPPMEEFHAPSTQAFPQCSPPGSTPALQVRLDISLIASRPFIKRLIDLFFLHVYPSLPIVNELSLRQDFENMRDAYDKHFYSLLLNICAATAVCLHGEPMWEGLEQRFDSWEQMGRSFNIALPPYPLSTMFREAEKQRSIRLCMLQNMLLVAMYERAIGSAIAFRLVGEASRFALAYGYHLRSEGMPTQESQLRRGIFWVLFCWDKWAALHNGQPMSIRSDEADTDLIDVSSSHDSPVDHSAILINPAALLLFNHLCRLALVAEQAILKCRWASTASLDHIALRTSMHGVIREVLATPCGMDPINGSLPFSVDQEPSAQSLALQSLAISAFIIQKAICLEVYHRYIPLFPPQETYSPLQSLQQIASHIINTLKDVPSPSIDRAGPMVIDMLHDCRRRLEYVVLNSDDPSGDPFVIQTARNDLHKYDRLWKEIDRLRIRSRLSGAMTRGTRTPSNVNGRAEMTASMDHPPKGSGRTGPSFVASEGGAPVSHFDTSGHQFSSMEASSSTEQQSRGDFLHQQRWQELSTDVDVPDLSSARFYNSLPFEDLLGADEGFTWDDLLQLQAGSVEAEFSGPGDRSQGRGCEYGLS